VEAWILSLAFAVLLVEPISAQDKPYSRKAAENSFRALVTAKDSDIINVIKQDGLVCFGDSLSFKEEDRFLTIVLPKPSDWFEDTSSAKPSQEEGSFYALDAKTEFPAYSIVILDFHEWINQDWDIMVDSLLDGKWHSYGHFQLKDGKRVWKAFSDDPPVFRFAKDKDEITGATDISAVEDGSVFTASKKYSNRNNGTTTYEMNMRLSTGRYKETWTTDKGDVMESVGNCYKAKEFARSATPTKKVKTP
jgi:hypothetical protein